MDHRRLALPACIAFSLAACAHPAPPAASPPTWKAPACAVEPAEGGGPPTGATVICEGTGAVSYEELREAATFESAKATLAARRTHLVIAGEQRRGGAPDTQCPKPAPDENLRTRLEYMTGGSVPTSGMPGPCKPIPGSEGHVLALTVRFLRNTEAATVPGARSASEVLGMSPPAPPSTDRGRMDAGRPDADGGGMAGDAVSADAPPSN